MNTPTPLSRSTYRAAGDGCLSCVSDLTAVKVLSGVRKVDALASGVVLVTHDGTVADNAIITAARQAGLDLKLDRPAHPIHSWLPWRRFSRLG